MPQVFTEERIDFVKLREFLGDEIDDRPERFSFTWAGRRDAVAMLQAPTSATLVPDKNESVNFTEAQHAFIEGENLETLKVIYRSYFGRMKTIYLDPSYNAGNDFIYPDNLADPLDHYLRITGQTTLFDTQIETWADYNVPSTDRNGAGGAHIYDGVPFDSDTIEKPFIQALEKRKDVKLYIKLPSWFTVATPIGAYNPDWATVMENPNGGDNLLYLVRETKSTLDLNTLRPDEKRKILCGRQHFRDTLEMGPRGYRVATEASQLPDGGV